MNNNLIGKIFVFDNEEYIIEGVFALGKRCIARNLNYNITEQFYTDNIIEWIKKEEI